jgi:hypothetical protein
MSASSARGEIFMEQSLALSSSSSVRSSINLWFAMSLLTKLEELKGSVSYKYFAPSGAGGHFELAESRPFSKPRA